MLDYEWAAANTSTIMLSGEEPPNPETEQTHHHHHHNQLDTTSYTDHTSLINNNNNHVFLHNPTNETSTFTHFHAQNQQHLTPFFDPRAYGGPSSYASPHMLSLDPVAASACGGGNGMFLVPKSEEVSRSMDFTSRIGLNLGGRTYFSSTEDDFVNRLYRRSRVVEPGSSHSPRCQAEGCNADLTHAKHYHRRHKVCEYHSKAATVVAAGLTQRFCQQCSRFHLLSEFDNGKRSCRKRLADHNRRRRKSHQANQESHKNQLEAARTSSSDNLARSPPDSTGAQSSSVTTAMSPPRILLDCFRPRPYHGGTTSSNSSSLVFFSTG